MVDRFLLIDLPVFLEVARQGNMTKAAAALHTVQSNITARIKRLEEHLGTTLVVRSPRKLRLTPEGEALMPFALRLEQLCRDVRTHFEQDDRPQGGSLRIGAIETFAASHLVGLIASDWQRPGRWRNCRASPQLPELGARRARVIPNDAARKIRGGGDFSRRSTMETANPPFG